MRRTRTLGLLLVVLLLLVAGCSRNQLLPEEELGQLLSGISVWLMRNEGGLTAQQLQRLRPLLEQLVGVEDMPVRTGQQLVKQVRQVLTRAQQRELSEMDLTAAGLGPAAAMGRAGLGRADQSELPEAVREALERAREAGESAGGWPALGSGPGQGTGARSGSGAAELPADPEERRAALEGLRQRRPNVTELTPATGWQLVSQLATRALRLMDAVEGGGARPAPSGR